MFEFNTVEEAVKDLKDGKIIIVTDECRWNKPYGCHCDR